MHATTWRVLALCLAVLAAAGLTDLLGRVAAQAPSTTVAFRIIIVSSTDNAEQIRQRLAAGGSFLAIARGESLDPSAPDGGLIGPVEREALRPDLRNALNTLRPGEISGVIRVPTGYALLQLVDDAPSGATPTLALSAAGSVKYVLSVDGFSEANATLETFEKPADWNQNPPLICDLRNQALAVPIDRLTRLLAPGSDAIRDVDPLHVVEAQFALGQLHAYKGELDAAIAAFESAYRVAAEQVPDAIDQAEEGLGIAYLHRAQMRNEMFTTPGDRCLLPSAATPASRPEDFRSAIARFERFLTRHPDSLEVKWLLNLAHMGLGTHPGGVPAAHRISGDVFASSESVGRFRDVAPQAGLESFSSAGGVAVDDFDNDGRLDVLTSNFASCGPMQLFQRSGAGPFKDRSTAAGLTGQLGGLNLSHADFDNDGCKDVLVMRGGWEIAQRRSLLKNNCDGTFTDVTVAAGLAKPATSSQTAVWADIDNDGWLDLFVGNEDQASQLFRNKGDGTFEEIARAAGVARASFTKGVAAGDYDNDGDQDLFVSNQGGGNYLYRNNGNLTFTEVSRDAGTPGADRGFPVWFFDYDNDGWLDLLTTSYYLSVEEAARTYLRLPNNAPTMKLYRNRRNGTFEDVTKAVGLDKVFMPMGSNFGDIDNDGWLDIYLGTGSPSYAALAPSVLLRNAGGQRFVDVTGSSGTGELHKGHGVAFADLDADGDEDIVFKVGGATPGDAHAFRLFENPGHGNDWVNLQLVGVKSNRAAIGARIAVTVESGGATRVIHRVVSTGGSFGASPLTQHIGLGRAARIRSVEVWWPASNTRQRFDASTVAVPKNQVLEIREGASTFTARSLTPLPWGKP